MNLKVTKDISFDIRDSLKVTWKEVIAGVLEKAKHPMSFQELYDCLKDHKKALNNHHLKAKIRQTLYRHNIFVHDVHNRYLLLYIAQ